MAPDQFEGLDLINKIEKLEKKIALYEQALEALARLDNGSAYGNSEGNVMALEALNMRNK